MNRWTDEPYKNPTKRTGDITRLLSGMIHHLPDADPPCQTSQKLEVWRTWWILIDAIWCVRCALGGAPRISEMIYDQRSDLVFYIISICLKFIIVKWFTGKCNAWVEAELFWDPQAVIYLGPCLAKWRCSWYRWNRSMTCPVIPDQ